jgi:hypothetical protein
VASFALAISTNSSLVMHAAALSSIKVDLPLAVVEEEEEVESARSASAAAIARAE